MARRGCGIVVNLAEGCGGGGLTRGVVLARRRRRRNLTRQDAASPRWESVEALRNAPTVRYCSAAKWRPWMFRFAAMVAHPSFYVRRECFERLGGSSCLRSNVLHRQAPVAVDGNGCAHCNGCGRRDMV